MLIYNVTYSVDLDVEADFLMWMRGGYIPQAVSTGVLRNPRLSMILTVDEQEKQHNYALQFEVDSLDALEEWSRQGGNELIASFAKHFGNKAPGFPTLMETVNL